MGSLSDLAYEYRDTGFQIYGVVADVWSGGDGQAEAIELFRNAGGTFENLLYSNSVGLTVLEGVSMAPTAKFYDSSGRLLTVVVGARSKQEWINIIETVMYEKT